VSRDAWLTIGAVLIVAGVSLLVGVIWYPGHRDERLNR
jgi:hypothetical protein